jgi:hypothetical protein
LEPPTAIITGSTMLGRCAEEFTLDSAMSTGGGPQPLDAEWSYVSATGTEELTIPPAELRASRLRVHFNSSRFVTGSHMFMLTVTNAVTGLSHSRAVNVTKTTADLPKVRIAGPPEISTATSRPLALRAGAELPECVTDASQLSLAFTWSLYNASTDAFDAVTEGPAAVFPPFTFGAGETRRVRVAVSSSGTAQSTADVTVVCQRSPLLAFIAGGTMRLVGRTADFLLDGSSSHDPDDPMELPAGAFSWSCTEHQRRDGVSWRPSQAPCTIVSPPGPTWHVAAGNLSADTRYRFVLTVSRDDRSTSVETVVEVSAGSPPDV